MKRWTLVGVAVMLGWCCSTSKLPAQEAQTLEPTAKAAGTDDSQGWTNLLTDEVFEKNWKVTEFGGEGPVDLKDGVLTLKPGVPLTGIHWKSENFPKDNYEVRWTAQRVEGNDFFACLTFPVGQEFCSVVVGGWGGGVVGISSINGSDASENESTQFMSFDNKRWYEFHLSVTEQEIVFKIDDDPMIEVPRAGNRFDTRIEVIRSRPLGYCAYQCVSQVKDFAYRDLAKAKPEAKQQSSKPLFMRVLSNDQDVMQSMQTAVAKYKITTGKYAGAQVDLIGAVHVGEHSYYEALNQRFKSYDALLFELVADPDIRIAGRKDQEGVINPVSSLQVAMKDALELEFQLDTIDYDAENFVHADMTPEEFLEDMRKRKDSFVNMFARVLGSSIAAQSTQGSQDAAMMAALMQPQANRAIALRRVFAQQMESSDMQLAGLADSEGLSTLVTERNAKAMQVLREQLAKGKRKLGIFYGAAHLDDMHARLLSDFQAELVETEWLDAWRLK